MEEIKTQLVTSFDIFILGLLIGGLLVVIARFAEQFLDKRILMEQKKSDLLLGEALLKMQKELYAKDAE